MIKKTVLVLSNITVGLVNFRGELLEQLASEYRVIVAAEDTGHLEEIKKRGCEFENIRIDRHGVNPLKDIKILLLYIKMIRKYAPFIVLTYTIKPNIYGGIACAYTNTPNIANITGLGDAIENQGILSLIARELYKTGLKKTKKVFFQNQSNCDFFIKNHMVNGSYCVLPGSGVNLIKNCFEVYPDCNEKEPLILSAIGRITKDKGIAEIIQASRHYLAQEIQIILIGDCEGKYLEQIHEARKNGVIDYVGRQENVHEWIKKSHAVLHASYHEGMSNVLLEAAACGRPIIATDIPGCREIFDNGISGVSFKPRDVASLVKAINHFMELSYEEKVRMGQAGRQKMEIFFDRNIVINQYLESIRIIEDAISK